MCLESYFSKISNLSKIYVFIDGNNVAYSRFNQCKEPILSDIVIIISYLIEKIGFSKNRIYCICDPSLKYYIDKPIEYKALIEEGIISEATKVADEFILSYALRHEFCFIISNDKFRDYIDQLPSKQWLNDRRISFMIINDEVCLSPNIDYEKLLTKDIFPLNRRYVLQKVTTIDALHRLETSEGELNLF